MPSAVPRSAPVLMRLTAVLLLTAGLLLAAPASASAHTGLRSSDPAADSTVTTTPQAVTLTFSASVLGGEVGVTGPDGTPVGAGPVAHDGAVLSLPVTLTAAGRHSVTWTAVADDGHALDGTFVFHHAPAAPLPPPAAPATGTPTSSDAAAQTTGNDSGVDSDTGTETASATSDSGGLPGWVLPVAAVALLAVGGFAAVRLRRR